MRTVDNGLIGLIGLARKAGRAELGEEAVTAAAHGHKARLILAAADAADNTLHRARALGEAGNAPVLLTGLTKEELGAAAGRQSCALLAITDVGLAAQAAKKLAREDQEGCGEAALALERRAEKALRRKREQRAKEKVRAARTRKPWAPPPKDGKT